MSAYSCCCGSNLLTEGDLRRISGFHMDVHLARRRRIITIGSKNAMFVGRN